MWYYSGVIVLAMSPAAFAVSPDWADALFSEHDKDFGAVARGTPLVHPFRVTNNTNQTIHIADARVSCGCTSTQIQRNDLAPGQSTTIRAEMDTRRFSGVKRVYIYVRFDQPQWEEVRLSVLANSRDDLLISPGGFDLGKVAQGSKASGAVTVSFLGGSSRIVGVETSTGYVQASTKELRGNGGEVQYEVTANLRADAPAGHWYTEVWLKPDSPSLGKIRIPLSVDIQESRDAITRVNASEPAHASNGSARKVEGRR